MKAFFVALLFGVYFMPNPYRVVYKSAPIDHVLMRLYQKHEILFPEIVLAQNRLETGNFSSAISKENLNQWGMKMNRHGYATSKNRGHAMYPSLEAGVQDYKRWQDQMIKCHNKAFGAKKGNIDAHSSVSDYLWFLDHLYISKGDTARYAEDPNYTKKLKKLLNKGL